MRLMDEMDDEGIPKNGRLTTDEDKSDGEDFILQQIHMLEEERQNQNNVMMREKEVFDNAKKAVFGIK